MDSVNKCNKLTDKCSNNRLIIKQQVNYFSTWLRAILFIISFKGLHLMITFIEILGIENICADKNIQFRQAVIPVMNVKMFDVLRDQSLHDPEEFLFLISTVSCLVRSF